MTYTLHVSPKHQSSANQTVGNVLDSSDGFPRAARLLTAADYASVFRKNRRLSDRYWTLLVHRGENPQPRLGLAIAKKRAKRAVDRNRIKRIAREVFRHSTDELVGVEIVIMNRDDTVCADNSTLRSALQKLIGDAG